MEQEGGITADAILELALELWMEPVAQPGGHREQDEHVRKAVVQFAELREKREPVGIGLEQFGTAFGLVEGEEEQERVRRFLLARQLLGHIGCEETDEDLDHID